MKIRILGNSLRLRLSQTEVRHLRSGGLVKESIRFGATSAQQLNYMLQKAAIPGIIATYHGNDICVSVPTDQAEQWADSEQVGLSQDIPIGDGDILHVLIEKDFQCLTERVYEDESDLFPNPGEGC